MQRKLRTLLSCLMLCTVLVSTPASAVSPHFSDVPDSYWAASQINRAVEIGLFNGRSNSWFGASRSMTRAEFAVVLCRLFGWEIVTPSSGSFTDNQNSSAWYYSAVETACLNGAVTLQSQTFRPGDPITREELSVMLVRALGYANIAGLTQNLPLPFQDVSANRGYLSMAYQLGIVSGTSATTFSPNAIATRAQAAVMLMRVYDKLHATAPALWGLAPRSADLTTEGMHIVAVPAARLTGGNPPALTPSMTDGEIQAVRSAASNAAVLLEVTGDSEALQADSAATASLLAAAVSNGGYGGLLLDIRQAPAEQKEAMTELVTAVRSALVDKLLYVTAEAPVWQGTTYGGYDFPKLAKQADRLVLRVAPYGKTSGGVLTAPEEPLEEVYYALSTLKSTVPPSQLSLLLTTTGSDGSDGTQIAGLLGTSGIGTYYSARYDSAYLVKLTGQGFNVVLWYHNAEAAAARRQLCAFFGVKSICLSDLTSLGNYGENSLLRGLK